MRLRTRLISIILALLTTITILAAAQTGSARVALEAAKKKEIVDGDLNGAIQQYKSIVAKYPKERAIVADSLIHMAECYQKLGDAQAQRIFEQVLREYADQTNAVAAARAHVGRTGNAAQTNAVSLRKLYTGDLGDYAGSISPDGRYLSHVGMFNTAVYLRDLVLGTDRLLTADNVHGTDKSVISRDGAQIAYDWCVRTRCELWIASLKGSGVPPSHRLFSNEDVFKVTPMDWSPDGKWIAVRIRRTDGTAQIGLIAVPDGSLQVLKTVEWRGPSKIFFSPDGRDLAFDLPASENGSRRDVFVIAFDASREISVVVHPSNDVVMGWSPDGQYLLFASDRSGTMDLWEIPFSDRRPQGMPQLLKSNIGSDESLGVTRAGALHVQMDTSDRDIEVVSVDLNSGHRLAEPVRPIQRFAGFNSEPAWSPDGKSLAYASERGSDRDRIVVIQSVTTGKVRELQLRPQLPWFVGLSWAPDGSSIAVFGSDIKGRDGLFRIDANTGEVVPIISPIEKTERLSYEGIAWSPDQKRIYYHSQNGAIRERDLASGHERVIISEGFGPISLSPDGRWIASVKWAAADKPTNTQSVVAIPVVGGQTRELLHLSKGQWVNNTAMPWAPDSGAVLVRKMLAQDGSASELWLVPINDTPARKIDIDVNRWTPYAEGKIRLNPDGRQLAYVTGKSYRTEAWMLENFLPGLKSTK